MARVLILDGHCSAALASVRSLGRAGHWVAIGYSHGSFAPSVFSRYCKLRWEYLASTYDGTRFSESVLNIVRQHEINLVIPMTDGTMWPLSVQRERFLGYARLALPSHQALEVVSDKYKTVALAQELGMPVPETILVHSVEDLQLSSNWSYPIVVKDRFSIRWINDKAVPGSVDYAYCRAELLNKVEQRLKKSGDALVQQFVAGVGIGFSCFTWGQNIFLPFQWQRIREKDPRGSGSATRMSMTLDENLFKYGCDLLARASFEGISMVEFKKDQNSGHTVLMEINGRPWGSMQLPIHCGIDYPRYLADWYLKGQLPHEQIEYKKGITCRWLTADLLHLENLWEGKPAGWPVAYPNFLASLFKICIPWYPGIRYDHFSIRDPRPGLADLGKWFQNHSRC